MVGVDFYLARKAKALSAPNFDQHILWVTRVSNSLSLRFGDESDRLLPSGFSEIANRDQNLFKAS